MKERILVIESRSAKEHITLYNLNRMKANGTFKLAPKEAILNEWSINQKSLFIESLLLGIYLPSIYLVEDSNGVKHAYDGYNRIDALIGYESGEFKLTGLEVLVEHEGLSFKEIKPML